MGRQIAGGRERRGARGQHPAGTRRQGRGHKGETTRGGEGSGAGVSGER